jgi:hypothetical protein
MAQCTHTSVRNSMRAFTKSIGLLSKQVLQLRLLGNLHLLVVALHVVLLLAKIMCVLFDTSLLQKVHVESIYVCIEPTKSCLLVTT